MKLEPNKNKNNNKKRSSTKIHCGGAPCRCASTTHVRTSLGAMSLGPQQEKQAKKEREKKKHKKKTL